VRLRQPGPEGQDHAGRDSEDRCHGCRPGIPNFTLQAGSNTFTVMAGPFWAIQQADFNLSQGDRLLVEAYPSLQHPNTWVAATIQTSPRRKASGFEMRMGSRSHARPRAHGGHSTLGTPGKQGSSAMAPPMANREGPPPESPHNRSLASNRYSSTPHCPQLSSRQYQISKCPAKSKIIPRALVRQNSGEQPRELLRKLENSNETREHLMTSD